MNQELKPIRTANKEQVKKTENQWEKHKPKRRTWTSIIDIGQVYDDGPLTPPEYLYVEDKYVAAVLSYMKYLRISELEAAIIFRPKEELFVKHIQLYPDGYSQQIVEFAYSVRNGETLMRKQIEHMVRLGLREDIVCQMRYEEWFFVNFTYDYYMDIDSSIICEEAINEIKQTGLFIDTWEWGEYVDNVWTQTGAK